MKAGKNYFEEQHSFLSIQKDLSIITGKLLEDEEFCKLLFYPQNDCLKGEKLTMEQKYSMLHKQIKIVPKVKIVPDCPNIVLITFNNFKPNDENPEFRDNLITFSIYCHPDGWNLGDFLLRPYAIANRIDTLFNKKKLTGIGTLNFLGGGNSILDGEYIGFEMVYSAIHGVEDKINPLTPMNGAKKK